MENISNNQEFVEEPVEEIVIEEVSIEEPESKGITFGKVINGSLNLRKGPSKDSDIIMILPEDTLVHYKGDKEEINGFTKVKIEEFIADGYVMDEFIKWDED